MRCRWQSTNGRRSTSRSHERRAGLGRSLGVRTAHAESDFELRGARPVRVWWCRESRSRPREDGPISGRQDRDLQRHEDRHGGEASDREQRRDHADARHGRPLVYAGRSGVDLGRAGSPQRPEPEHQRQADGQAAARGRQVDRRRDAQVRALREGLADAAGAVSQRCQPARVGARQGRSARARDPSGARAVRGQGAGRQHPAAGRRSRAHR